ncbi:MAG TPA: hypothetical protein VMY42_01120 [Thermoguttaceae bacterium]|nr:hypothetical protein [Thermoguttaceae bacterium]
MQRLTVLASWVVVGVFCLAAAGTVQAKTKAWNVPGDFATIQEAIDSDDVLDGDTIRVKKGSRAGAEVTKSVNIVGVGNPVIDSGPMHPAGLSMGFQLLAGSDGTTISHLSFAVDLAIMNGAAVNYVTVEHCSFDNTIQAVSNWRGSGWDISHNVITDLRTRNGGGIGILVADFSGGVVEDNIVSHNKISGTLHVDPADGGGYAGTGIVLYADFRWGGAGASAITNNAIVMNDVSLVSDTPAVVDVVGIELTDTRDDGTLKPVVYDNWIGYNDLRGTEDQIGITPPELELVNDIFRNLGENRGHGMFSANAW